MEKKKTELSRRDFSKLIVGAGAVATVTPFAFASATATEKEKASSEIRKQFTVSGMESPIKINEKFKGFSEANTCFYHPSTFFRDFHGKKAPWFYPLLEMKHKLIEKAEHAPGVKASSVADARTGRAFEAAGWTLNQHFGNMTPNRHMLKWEQLPASKPWKHVYNRLADERDPVKLTTSVKYAARMSGADLVGIAKLNRNWVYKTVVTTSDDHTHDQVKKAVVFKDADQPHETETEFVIPNDCENVIVTGFAMNREAIQTAPASMACAAVSFAYSRMTVSDIWMAQFIRAQGYYAIPACSGMGQVVAMAIEAGLGQPSRMGALITPEFGPNLRLSKIFTNMPLTPDKPIDFGVEKFCQTCKKCARECPSKSIGEGSQSYDARVVHNTDGRYQWHNDHKKCHDYWIESGGDCAICIAVCPFTKGNIWIHDGVEWMIDNTPFLDSLMLGMDDALGYGEMRDCEDIWKGKINTYGLDTDHFQDTEDSYGKKG